MFHKGGARLILCGKSWEKLEELADDLEKTSDPTKVRGKQGEGLTLTVKSTMFTDAAGMKLISNHNDSACGPNLKGGQVDGNPTNHQRSAQTRKSYHRWLNGKEREMFFLLIFFASDFPLKAGAAGLRGHGQHARGHHRDPGVLRLPRRPHPQQRHEAQSPCADHISGDGQADHGPQLLRASHSGQRYDRL